MGLGGPSSIPPRKWEWGKELLQTAPLGKWQKIFRLRDSLNEPWKISPWPARHHSKGPVVSVTSPTPRHALREGGGGDTRFQEQNLSLSMEHVGRGGDRATGNPFLHAGPDRP